MENKRSFFEKFMGLVNKIGSYIMLNLLFMVSCIPVVTIGAAVSGLYSAIRFGIRGESTFRGFWEGFKTRWLRSCIGTVLSVAVAAYALNNFYTIFMGLRAAPELMSVSAVASLILSGGFFLAALLLSTAMIPVNLYFQNDLNGWLVDAWRLIAYAPLQTLAVALLMWFPIALLVLFPFYGYLALLIFVAVYYAAIGVVATALLKNGLIRILQQFHSEERA